MFRCTGVPLNKNSVVSNNGLATNRRQVIIWTNDDIVYRRVQVWNGVNETASMRQGMMTSSNWNMFCFAGPLCGSPVISGQNNSMTRPKAFKFWDLVRFMLDIWRYSCYLCHTQLSSGIVWEKNWAAASCPQLSAEVYKRGVLILEFYQTWNVLFSIKLYIATPFSLTLRHFRWHWGVQNTNYDIEINAICSVSVRF